MAAMLCRECSAMRKDDVGRVEGVSWCDDDFSLSILVYF
jgi:hypothetical protein